MMVTREQAHTAEELLKLSNDGKHYELIEGRLIELTPTGRPHGLLTARFAYLLANYVEQHDLGEVLGAETGFRLAADPDTVVGVDAAFISKARTKPDQQGYLEGAPDIAIEVVSPGNTQAEMHNKVQLYFRAGAKLVWVVYPIARAIYVYTSATEVTILEPSDTLTGGDVLPGFSVVVSNIFAVLDNK